MAKEVELLGYCKGCAYLGSLDSHSKMPCCDYILKESRRRGCPPGDGCTKRRLKKRRRISGKVWAGGGYAG